IQPWKANVESQHDSQQQPVQVHGTGNSLRGHRLFHQGLEVEVLQHSDHRQQSAVGSQILTIEVIGRGSIDFIGSGAPSCGPCFTGVLRLSFFLSVTIWVTSLGSVLRSGNFAELLLYPNIHGVPKWFTALPPAGAGSSQCIDQVTEDGRYCFLEVNPYGQWLWAEKKTGLPISQTLVTHLSAMAHA